MKRIVENLRAKPEHIRERWLYIISLSLTGLIFIFWVITLHARLSTQESKDAFQNDLKPFTILKDDLSSSYQDISSTINSIKK